MLALFCVWLQVAGGLVMYLGFLTTHGAGPDGWTAFLPLANARYTPGSGMDMWVLGVIVANAGQLVLAGVILATDPAAPCAGHDACCGCPSSSGPRS